MTREDVEALTDERPPRGPLAWAALLVIAVAGILAYHNGFHGPFVFDDIPAIRDNATLRSLWPPRVALSPPEVSGLGGRPLANLSFALNRALTGPGVTGYHAGNLLLHILSAWLLFGVVRRTQVFFGARQNALPLAFATALAWVMHPLGTAAVTWLSQRTELLMAFCYLATLYAFLRATETPSPRWLIASVAACAAGMLCKETMVTAPLMILLYDRSFGCGTFRAAWRRHWPYYTALASTWLLLAYQMFTTGLSQRSVGFGLGVSPLTYALTECRAWLLYLKLALWPSPLVFDYGALYASSAWITAASVGLMLGFFGWMVHAFHRRTAGGFAAACFALMLLPSSSVVPVAEQPIAENRMYLPLALVIAALVTLIYVATGKRLLRALPAFAAALGLLVLARNVDYRGEISLWTDTVEKRPQNPRAHFNRGIALLDAGRAADAIAAFERAIALKPSEPKAHNSLGNALLDLNRPAEALPHFVQAIALAPRYARAWSNAGTALFRTGDLTGAMARFEHALRLDGTIAEVHQGLGNIQFQQDRPSQAIPHYEAALRINPALADAHYNAGSACFELGRVEDAIRHFSAAAQQKPADAEIQNNLGAALLRAGKSADAIAAFETALRLKPDYADARDNLALAQTQAASARPR